MLRDTLRPIAYAIRSAIGTNGLSDRMAGLEAALLHASNTRINQEEPLPAAKHVKTIETVDPLKGFRVGAFADLDEMNASFEQSPLRERTHEVARFLLKVDELPLQQAGDPFSDEYREQVVQAWSRISGRDGYNSRRDELAPYLDPQAALLKPAFYASGDSRYVGEVLSGIGFILQQLNVRAGDAVLEYGAGEGQIALTLVRTGCQVAVIDVESKYLDGIILQARAIGAEIAVQQGVFGDAFADGRTFDRILFFEAFHHALEHKKVLRQLHAHLKPGG
jgi:2-polyprenyl-3-methyl-5-hydroxy-6-metoxy-1,4-benzoquinol methylase